MGDLIYLPDRRWPHAGRCYCPPAEQEPDDRWPWPKGARYIIGSCAMFWLVAGLSVVW